MQKDLIESINKISRHPLLEKMTEERRRHFMGNLSENCIHGICTGVECNNCGCCDRNNDIKDRLKKLLEHFKYELKRAKAEECLNEHSDLRKFQYENKVSSIRYCKKQIKKCQALLKSLEESGVEDAE